MNPKHSASSPAVQDRESSVVQTSQKFLPLTRQLDFNKVKTTTKALNSTRGISWRPAIAFFLWMTRKHSIVRLTSLLPNSSGTDRIWVCPLFTKCSLPSWARFDSIERKDQRSNPIDDQSADHFIIPTKIYALIRTKTGRHTQYYQQTHTHGMRTHAASSAQNKQRMHMHAPSSVYNKVGVLNKTIRRRNEIFDAMKRLAS